MTEPGLETLLERWSADLGSWAVPQVILDQAEQPPWIHPVGQFTVVGEVPDSPSHRIAREAVPAEGSVLDVGSGGGRASSALVPPAGMIVGVDHVPGMLEAFAEMAVARGVRHHEYLGHWQQVADDVPECDVVVCHHVAFNVPEIGSFLRDLDAHARHRVVLELPMHHPQSNLNWLWKHFWGLDRPLAPTAHDLHAIALALGFNAQITVWHDDTWGSRVPQSQAELVEQTRLRLCLPASRSAEVDLALRESPEQPARELATIWWDTGRA